MKTIIITGANSGIGYVTAKELARDGHHIVFAGRSRERNEEAMEALRSELPEAQLSFEPLDLGSLQSVKDFGESWSKKDQEIDILINNAGLAGQQGITQDGFELHFGVNHLGHFYLTHLLLPHLKKEQGARIVNVASRAHTRVKGISFDHLQERTRTTSGFPEYCESKLANVCFNRSLAPIVAERGIHTYALHPGVVASNIWSRLPGPIESFVKLFMLSNEDGAKTSIYCARSPECAKENGLYYDKCRTKSVSKVVTPDLEKRLWDLSMEWCSLTSFG